MTITPGAPPAATVNGALPATVSHVLHPEHRLSLVNIPSSCFTCDVCKQHGEGTAHYRCKPCDFDAHAACATAPATFKHVNYSGDFVLFATPVSGQMYCCAACGREALGYRYYNRDHDCRLHPCCAFLPRRVVQDGRAFDLGYHPSGTCGMCKKSSGASLSYRSSYDDGRELFLHVRCLVDANNSLTGYQNWVASAPIRPGVMSTLTVKKGGGGASAALPATVSHDLHPEHKLSLVNTHHFHCNVCKMYGKGTVHYRCEPCDFDAHPDCATAPPTFKHLNYADNLVLYTESSPGDPQRYCGLCGCEVLGYRYYNRQEDSRLHPCCAFMPRRVVQDGRAFDLDYHPSGTCSMCRRRTTASLSYRSRYDDGEAVYLHVWCLVDTNNRLTGYQDWVASAPIRPGVLGSFTRKKAGGGTSAGDTMRVINSSLKLTRFALKVAGLDFGDMGDLGGGTDAMDFGDCGGGADATDFGDFGGGADATDFGDYGDTGDFGGGDFGDSGDMGDSSCDYV
ncbi:unnamed protein product [Alopecurus aequalis]